MVLFSTESCIFIPSDSQNTYSDFYSAPTECKATGRLQGRLLEEMSNHITYYQRRKRMPLVLLFASEIDIPMSLYLFSQTI